LANPDNGSCKSLTTKMNCEKQRSQLNNQQSKCKWENETTIDGKCIFNDSTFNWIVIIFISLFTLFMSAPIMMLINFIIQEVLTGKIKKEETMDNIETNKFNRTESNRRHLKFMTLQNRFQILSNEILSYRRKIFDKDLIAEFDSKIGYFSYYFT
jgi:hypothetical protein